MFTEGHHVSDWPGAWRCWATRRGCARGGRPGHTGRAPLLLPRPHQGGSGATSPFLAISPILAPSPYLTTSLFSAVPTLLTPYFTVISSLLTQSCISWPHYQTWPHHPSIGTVNLPIPPVIHTPNNYFPQNTSSTKMSYIAVTMWLYKITPVIVLDSMVKYVPHPLTYPHFSLPYTRLSHCNPTITRK